MEKLINLLHNGAYSCVISNGEDVRSFCRRGIIDIYELMENDPIFLKGALLADKVIGRGAAALMTYCGVTKVYSDVVSEGAINLFEKYGVSLEYQQRVPFIINRTGDDWCPLEKRCRDVSDLNELKDVIDLFINSVVRIK